MAGPCQNLVVCAWQGSCSLLQLLPHWMTLFVYRRTTEPELGELGAVHCS